MMRAFADCRASRTSLVQTNPRHSMWLSSRSGRVRIALMVLALATPGQSWANGATCPDFAAAVLHNSGGNNPSGVTIGDVSGDGKPDLVVANSGSHTVSILLGSGNGLFAPAVTYAVGFGPRAAAIADVNGDGKADLAVANEGFNTVSILLGNGNGTFAAAVGYGTGA